MAGKKISELNPVDSLNGSEEVEVLQVGANKRSTLTSIKNWIFTLIGDVNHNSLSGKELASDEDAEFGHVTGTQHNSYLQETIIIACSDETTALTTGTAKVTFRMPFALTLTTVRASLTSAGSTSGLTTVDINESGTTILSTKLSIDYGEKTSTTAETPAVISDTALADDSEITIDIDAVTGGADETGLKVYLIGYRA